MDKFVLSTDTCCDELKSKLEEENIKYIKMSYICGDEVNYDNANSLDDYEAFYNEMRSGKMFSTTGLNMQETKEYFEKLLSETDKDILHITLSSGLSGTYGVVQHVADELNETHSQKIYIFDSLSATQVQNAIVYLAKECRDKGYSVTETFNKLTDSVKHLHAYFFLNDLDTLKRGGRINGVQAVLGKAIQLRPVLSFDSEGKLRVIEKVIGTKKAVRALIDRFSALYDPSFDQPIFLAYAGETSEQEIEEIIREKAPNAKIISGPVGPVIASHTGPALSSVIFYSKYPRMN